MAGHIQDRWYKTEVGSDGKTIKVKTERYGSGMRYRARYVGPDGTEKSKSFPAASPCSPRPRVASCGTCRCPVRSRMPSGTT